MRSIAGDLLLQRLTEARLEAPGRPRNRLLYECIQRCILDGSLAASSRLPPSRDLAGELGVSRNTVMHAYEQLQAEGYLRTLTGSGTFVTDGVPDTDRLRPAARFGLGTAGAAGADAAQPPPASAAGALDDARGAGPAGEAQGAGAAGDARGAGMAGGARGAGAAGDPRGAVAAGDARGAGMAGGAQGVAAPDGDAPPPRLSQRGQALVARARASPRQWGAFVPGVPDVTEFPHRRFAKIASRLWRAPPPEWLSYSEGGGHPALRQALAVHLKQARSVEGDADQVLVTEGVHQAIDLISRVLGQAGDEAWLEEPGYWGIRNILAMNGLQVRPMPVDGQGLKLPAGRGAAPPKFIFVTPSHQYPLGSVMSLPRRVALLEYAREHGCWIVEDDYDSEFRFSGRPFPALQGLTRDANVIYVGTFSKTLYPGLRTAYMVLPRALAAPFRIAHSELYREGHAMAQAALAEFIASGQYASHIRRMRLVYEKRRALLVSLIEQWLGRGWLHEHDSNAGLHLVLALPDGADDVAIARAALERGVIVRPLSQYYAGESHRSGLLLGFACVREADMLAPFTTLVQCIDAGLGRAPRA